MLDRKIISKPCSIVVRANPRSSASRCPNNPVSARLRISFLSCVIHLRFRCGQTLTGIFNDVSKVLVSVCLVHYYLISESYMASSSLMFSVDVVNALYCSRRLRSAFYDDVIEYSLATIKPMKMKPLI